MFNWKLFLDTAKSLLNDKTESAQRTAISRSYYAIYHKAKSKAILVGHIEDRNKSSHKQLWDFYQGHPDKKYQGIGRRGERMKWGREGADYESKTIIIGTGYMLYNDALNLLRDIDNL